MDKENFQYCCICGKLMYRREYDWNSGEKSEYDKNAVCSAECLLERRKHKSENKTVKIKVTTINKIFELIKYFRSVTKGIIFVDLPKIDLDELINELESKLK